jgi:hypothetical protein
MLEETEIYSQIIKSNEYINIKKELILLNHKDYYNNKNMWNKYIDIFMRYFVIIILDEYISKNQEKSEISDLINITVIHDLKKVLIEKCNLFDIINIHNLKSTTIKEINELEQNIVYTKNKIDELNINIKLHINANKNQNLTKYSDDDNEIFKYIFNYYICEKNNYITTLLDNIKYWENRIEILNKYIEEELENRIKIYEYYNLQIEELSYVIEKYEQCFISEYSKIYLQKIQDDLKNLKNLKDLQDLSNNNIIVNINNFVNNNFVNNNFVNNKLSDNNLSNNKFTNIFKNIIELIFNSF